MRLSALGSRLSVLVLSAELFAPVAARAQSTRQQIDSAKALYEAFQVEAARPILLNITSPGYRLAVSPAEKAEAFKYLGASYAVLASRDSAINYFMGALDYDPFTDLDPTKFAAAELSAFGEAKSRLFKVAIRPLPGPAVVSRDSAIRLSFITTQRAAIHVDLASANDTIVLYDGPNDGARTISWQGLLTTGAYAAPGIYQLRIRGISSTRPNEPQTESMTIRIEHVFEPLEDTLRSLDPNRPGDLLPERIKPSEPWIDLIKGASVAMIAVGVPLAALQTSDISWTAHAGTTAFVGLSSGAISFWYRRKYPQIKRNVDENALRHRLRDEHNAKVRLRNQARLDRTLLIISPVSSLGQ